MLETRKYDRTENSLRLRRHKIYIRMHSTLQVMFDEQHCIIVLYNIYGLAFDGRRYKLDIYRLVAVTARTNRVGCCFE